MKTPAPPEITFGQRLKEQRVLADLTQEDLASAVGLSRASIANYETDRQNCVVETALAIEWAIGCPPGEIILDRDGEPLPEREFVIELAVLYRRAESERVGPVTRRLLQLALSEFIGEEKTARDRPAPEST